MPPTSGSRPSGGSSPAPTNSSRSPAPSGGSSKPSGGGSSGGGTYFGQPTSPFAPSGTYIGGSGGGTSYRAPSNIKPSYSGGGGGGSSGSVGSSGGSGGATTTEMAKATDLAASQKTAQQVSLLPAKPLTPAGSTMSAATGASGQPLPTGALTSKWEATKASAQILGRDVGILFSGAFGRGKDYSGLENPLKPFEYTTPTMSAKEIANPLYSPQRATYNPADIRMQPFTTYGKLESYGNVAGGVSIGVDTGARQFSSAKAGEIAKTAGIVALNIAVPETLFMTGAYQVQKYAQQTMNPNLPTEQRVMAGVSTGLGFAGVYGGAFGTLTKFERQQVQISSDFLKSKSKTLFGVRTIEGASIRDIYGTKIVTDSGKLNIRVATASKMFDETKFATVGSIEQRMSVQGYWTGNIYSNFNKQIISGKGILMPPSAGITPSIGKMQSLEFVNIKSTLSETGMKVRADIFPKGMTSKFFGGVTKEFKTDWVLSRGGQLMKFTQPTKIMRGPYESGTFDFLKYQKMLLKSPSNVVLKIKEVKFSGDFEPPSFGGVRRISKQKISTDGTRTEQMSMLGTKQMSNLMKIPAIEQKTSSIKGVTMEAPSMSLKTVAISTSMLGTKQISAVGTRTEQMSMLGTKRISALGSKMQSLQLQKSMVGQGVMTKTTQLLQQKQLMGVMTTTPELGKMQKVQQTYAFPMPSFPSMPAPLTPRINIPMPELPFAFPMPKADFSFPSARMFGARGRRKYTPSYEALLFGIKGKAPKRGGFKMALGTRPITKGFKWAF